MTHAYELRDPGFHGSDSVTARCLLGCWSRTIFRSMSPPSLEEFERATRGLQAAHEHDEQVLQREREQAARLWRKMTPKEAKYAYVGEPRFGPVARRLRDDADAEAFAVTFLTFDERAHEWVAQVHPKGYPANPGRGGRGGRITILPKETPLEESSA